MAISNITYPVSDIMRVSQACQTGVAVARSDPRYYDFSLLRGNNLVDEVSSALMDAALDKTFHKTFHHRCLCGHMGSGKSTELLAVQQKTDAAGFLSIVVEVDKKLGVNKVEFSDLYLLAAQAVEQACCEIRKPLPQREVERVSSWFAEITHEDKKTIQSEIGIEAGVEVGVGIPLLGKLVANFFAKSQAGSEHAKTAKRLFRETPSVLIDMTNQLLRSAAEAVKEIKPLGVLVILDNLDRSDRDDIYAILTAGRGLMQEMACHVLYTMPIHIVYSAPDPAQNCFGHPPFVLPMVPLRRRDAPWKRTVEETEFIEDHVDKMVEALGRRINIPVLFEDPEDARLLVKMSGGHIRDLMHLVNSARLKCKSDTPQFTREAVRRGIVEYGETVAAKIEDADYPLLVAHARKEETMDDRVRNALYQRFLLEYLDDHGKRWRDIHPLLLDREKMQNALFPNQPLPS